MEKNIDTFEKNIEQFQTTLKIDYALAKDNTETIMSLGIEKIVEMTIDAEEDWGYIISIQDDTGLVYVITLDEYGSLGTVRKDALQGEIIYLLNYD
jgi:hypothetical protein